MGSRTDTLAPFPGVEREILTMLENEKPPVTGRGAILFDIYTLLGYDNKRVR